MTTTIWLHIWDGGLGKVFLEINKADLAQLRKHYGDFANINYFSGKTATVVTISDSRYTTRGECLEISEKRVKGQYDVYRIDLDSCTASRTKGTPIPRNPR